MKAQIFDYLAQGAIWIGVSSLRIAWYLLTPAQRDELAPIAVEGILTIMMSTLEKAGMVKTLNDEEWEKAESGPPQSRQKGSLH